MRQLKKICILIAGILLVSCCFATDIYAQAAEGETQECYTHEFYQKKYTSGCWSCLVLEKLTSAFLKVASAAMPICEKAGHILLIWGFMIWMCFWALKNVASFTEIKGGNILNELLQMAGRVVIAYVCITMGTTAIRQFIINPIMGVGATMAQNFWSANSGISNYNKALSEYMTDFIWDDTGNVDFTEEYIEAQQEEVTSTPVVTEEEANQQNEVSELDEELGAEMEIPPFQVPGTNGVLTSFPGCRVPPPTDKKTNCGSYAHMGLDVGAAEGTPIWAMAGGKVTYLEVGGYGKVAIVTTTHKGNKWQHLYAHMNCNDWNKYKAKLHNQEVVRGTIIGGVGRTSNGCYNGYGAHLHVELTLTGNVGGKQYTNAILDPVSLGEGKIVVRGRKHGTDISNKTDVSTCKCNNSMEKPCTVHNSWTATQCTAAERQRNKICRGFKSSSPPVSMIVGQEFERGGITAPGVAKVESSNISGIGGSFLSNGEESLIVSIPDVKYTGPTDIMPKSIMDSLIGATKAITDTTAQFMVLGNMAMCFSNMKDGGAWDLGIMHLTNVFIWIDGLILLVLGFILTCVVAYYLIDMSFKIGFAVMALPIVMGLWPFKVTQDKLATTISIIAKSAALFAFLALATYYGLELVVASFGGADGMAGIFNDFDQLANGTASADEKSAIVDRLEGHFYIFSTKFLMMLFGVIYAYKLISQTTKDLVEKFYPDGAFGSENPMHKMMTGMASIAKNINRKYGTGLVEDIAANSAGKMVKNAAGKTAASARAAGRAAGGAIRGAIRKIRK